MADLVASMPTASGLVSMRQMPHSLLMMLSRFVVMMGSFLMCLMSRMDMLLVRMLSSGMGSLVRNFTFGH